MDVTHDQHLPAVVAGCCHIRFGRDGTIAHHAHHFDAVLADGRIAKLERLEDDLGAAALWVAGAIVTEAARR